ncbi:MULTISPECIES: sigma-70 family RNA polymerase sigma factor [Streptomyces]|uniref:Sigma-70 family RNA polymerase sigma factor n=1 Tax=Streptomyces solicathayae TaxID=3081768 RepID=A0ABZ0LU21_9ACTN|nr:sigma-70 family RNA polymerase sigma factor [Streptomyces sp. HUAS YS2]WOX22966.1 sigma-70 family RNA polymerase sigma factor [Streptomyces sp. HUAS YS2]
MPSRKASAVVDEHRYEHERALLARRFEEQRGRLRAVAYRMLGSFGEADDAVQETWLRLNRADTAAIENLADWLTTAVGRVSLTMLHSRTSRTETEGPHRPEETTHPEERALLSDAAETALLAVLDTLTPGERLAFVLHDLFAVPFEDIAPIVDRTPAATRQLAGRARRRVQGLDDLPEPDPERQREVVTAFLAAARSGDAEALLALLDPDVVLRADATAVTTGATPAHGARAVAETFAGRAAEAVPVPLEGPVLIDGMTGLTWDPAGKPRCVVGFTVLENRIAAIDLVADEDHLDRLTVSPLPAGAPQPPTRD